MAKWLFTAPGAAAAGWVVEPLGMVVEPQVLAAARATLAFVVLFVYLAVRHRPFLKVRVRDLPFLLVFGIVGLALLQFAYFKTISLTGVATAILLEYLAPVIVMVFSVGLLRERFTITLPLAVTMSVLGCALTVGAVDGAGGTVPPLAIAWGLGAAVLFAAYQLMGKYAADRFTPWTLLVYGLGVATLFWLLALGGPGPLITLLSDARAFVAVLVLAVVSTVIPFGVFLIALRHIEATKASVSSTLEPVFAGVAAWILFSERLTPLQLLGGVLVVAAVVVSQLQPHVSTVACRAEQPSSLSGMSSEVDNGD